MVLSGQGALLELLAKGRLRQQTPRRGLPGSRGVPGRVAPASVIQLPRATLRPWRGGRAPLARSWRRDPGHAAVRRRPAARRRPPRRRPVRRRPTRRTRRGLRGVMQRRARSTTRGRAPAPATLPGAGGSGIGHGERRWGGRGMDTTRRYSVAQKSAAGKPCSRE
jgi:hypothetical protein